MWGDRTVCSLCSVAKPESRPILFAQQPIPKHGELSFRFQGVIQCDTPIFNACMVSPSSPTANPAIAFITIMSTCCL
jgi:hypothetical protein